jgi:hypothetical protein
MQNKTRNLLSVHVIGAGKGESIILQMPNGQWGVVDCYARVIKDPLTNPTLRFLRRNGVEQLLFLCLTHPHEDHFRGITHLLDEYEGRIGEIWRFAARPLYQVIAHLQAEAVEGGGHPIKRSSVAELTEFFRRVDAMRKRSAVAVRLVEGYKLLLSTTVAANGENVPLKIFALGPSGTLVDAYQAAIENYFVGKHTHAKTPRHNQISGVLKVQWGQTSVVLGADAERESWEAILSDSIRQTEGTSLAADLVKISHHGSKNGIAKNLWDELTADSTPERKCDAVLTPFFAQRLPDTEALEQIRNYTDEIFSTSVARPLKTANTLLFESQLKRRLNRANADARLLDAPPEQLCRCSFSFSATGELVESEFEGGGGKQD